MVEENIIRQQELEFSSLVRLLFFAGHIISECRNKVIYIDVLYIETANRPSNNKQIGEIL